MKYGCQKSLAFPKPTLFAKVVYFFPPLNVLKRVFFGFQAAQVSPCVAMHASAPSVFCGVWPMQVHAVGPVLGAVAMGVILWVATAWRKRRASVVGVEFKLMHCVALFLAEVACLSCFDTSST